MTIDIQIPAEHAAVEHLTPERWAAANRALVAKALAEFAHERLLTPRAIENGRYAVDSDDGGVTYTFVARRYALDHWRIDPASVTRRSAVGAELPLDVLDLALEVSVALGLRGEQLGLYLEELSSTASALAFKHGGRSTEELLDAGFQAIETGMTEGHPCFVANSGRLGFSADDYARFAPEAAVPVRLLWVAAHRDHATFSAARDTSYEDLLDRELGAEQVARFGATMAELGLDLADYLLIPVHPWQWTTRLAVTFAADVARRRLVCVGAGDDEHLAQQSIRTFFNVSDPARDYVKTALSVVNMGFVRGLSAQYMEGTPQINDWVADLVAGDARLAATGVEVLRERASVGYRPEHYDRDPYTKMLAALWRESPVPRVREGERLATMASLLHVDADGRSLAATLIERSGLSAEAWLDAYLDAYLTPLLHCFFAHDLVFMPHGENIILVLEDHVPRRVLLKDIAEEIVLMDPDRPLPEAVERIRAEVPDELKKLSLLTDVVDCFLRFLGPVLAEAGTIDEDGFWGAVAACIERYDDPAVDELFTERFALSCLNRLQLANSRQMVDLQDPAGSLQLLGTLPNPLAAFRPRR